MVSKTDGLNVNDMKTLSDELIGTASGQAIVILGAVNDDKVNFVIKISKDLVKNGLHAGKLIKEVANVAGGGGGGRPDMATAGGKIPAKIDEALETGKNLIIKTLAE